MHSQRRGVRWSRVNTHRPLNVLLVESQPETVSSVVRAIESLHPQCRVNVVKDQRAASRVLSESTYDAVLQALHVPSDAEVQSHVAALLDSLVPARMPCFEAAS